jgi:hypothetical protein
VGFRLITDQNPQAEACATETRAYAFDQKYLRQKVLSGFDVAAAAFQERGVQPLADIFGEGNGFRVAKNLEGFAGGVYDDSAIRAAGEVEFEIGSHLGVEDAVEIACQF